MKTYTERTAGLLDYVFIAAIVTHITPDGLPLVTQWGWRIGLFLGVSLLVAVAKPSLIKYVFAVDPSPLPMRTRVFGFLRSLVALGCGALPAWAIYFPGRAWLEPVVGATAADWITILLALAVGFGGYYLCLELLNRKMAERAPT